MKCKSVALILVMLLLTVSFAVTGCGPEEVVEEPPEEADPDDPITDDEVYKLVIHDPSRILTFKEGLNYFKEEVPKRTDGRVEVEMILGGALGGFAEQPDGIAEGVFDMGMLPIGYHPGKTPLWQVGEMPGITGSLYAHNMALVEMAEHPTLKAELEERWNQKLLFPGSMDTFEMLTAHPIESVDDLDGYSIRAIALASTVLERLGANVSAIPGPDVFTSMERGVVDGAVFPVDTFVDRDLHTLADNLVLSGQLGFYFGLVTINLDTWNGLPADIQQVIEEVSAEAVERNIEIYLEANLRSKQAYEEAETNIIRLSEEERARIQEVNEQLWEEWVAARKDQGYTEAQEVFDLWVQLVRKYEEQDPYVDSWWPERF